MSLMNTKIEVHELSRIDDAFKSIAELLRETQYEKEFLNIAENLYSNRGLGSKLYSIAFMKRDFSHWITGDEEEVEPLTEEDLEKSFAAGRQAGVDGESRLLSPFLPGTVLDQEWSKGWNVGWDERLTSGQEQVEPADSQQDDHGFISQETHLQDEPLVNPQGTHAFTEYEQQELLKRGLGSESSRESILEALKEIRSANVGSANVATNATNQ